jgi:hypothetical protein
MQNSDDEIQFSDQISLEFIEPTGENGEVHVHLTDAGLLDMSIDGIETDRTEDGIEEGEEDGEEEEEEGPPPWPSKDILAAMDLVMN